MRKTLILLACLSIPFGMVLSACKKDNNPAPTAPPSGPPADTSTFTATATPPFSPTPTFTPTQTLSPTPTFTRTHTGTPTVTRTPTATFTQTLSPYPTCAAAPVSIGYTALGSAYPIMNNELTVLGSPITLAAPATIRWVGFYKFYTGTGNTKAAIYNSNATSDPTTLIVQSTYALGVASAAGWYKVQIPPTSLPAGTYWAVTWSDSSTSAAAFGHYQTSGTGYKIKLVNQPDFPASLGTNYAYQAMNYTLEYCP